MTKLYKNQSFTISHADASPFVGDGLRAFFEYRDLGIKSATQGEFGAHVIRAVPGRNSPGTWHTHDLDFQMVYVTKGWVVFEYEGPKEQGGGEHMLRAGSCALQPPRHQTSGTAPLRRHGTDRDHLASGFHHHGRGKNLIRDLYKSD